jgi:hypothetical protein
MLLNADPSGIGFGYVKRKITVTQCLYSEKVLVPRIHHGSLAFHISVCERARARICGEQERGKMLTERAKLPLSIVN